MGDVTVAYAPPEHLQTRSTRYVQLARNPLHGKHRKFRHEKARCVKALRTIAPLHEGVLGHGSNAPLTVHEVYRWRKQGPTQSNVKAHGGVEAQASSAYGVRTYGPSCDCLQLIGLNVIPIKVRSFHGNSHKEHLNTFTSVAR